MSAVLISFPLFFVFFCLFLDYFKYSNRELTVFIRDSQYYETVTMEMEIYDDEEDGNFLLLFEIFL